MLAFSLNCQVFKWIILCAQTTLYMQISNWVCIELLDFFLLTCILKINTNLISHAQYVWGTWSVRLGSMDQQHNCFLQLPSAWGPWACACGACGSCLAWADFFSIFLRSLSVFLAMFLGLGTWDKKIPTCNVFKNLP